MSISMLCSMHFMKLDPLSVRVTIVRGGTALIRSLLISPSFSSTSSNV